MDENVPKNFVLMCQKCKWSKKSTGLKEDLANLTRLNDGCLSCGKIKKYKCPKCGGVCVLKRIKGNS
jgi:hypothetical protein